MRANLKTVMALALGAAALLGAVTAGPELWGFWRFTQISNADEADIAREPVRALAETCFVCHGSGGQSRSEAYPRLAGQDGGYLERALDEMASGERRAPRMAPLARALSGEQKKALAEWFARQPPAPGIVGAAPDSLASCTTCHGEGLKGDSAQGAPRLAGLGWAYVEGQLSAYRAGDRGGADGAMRGVAAALDAQMLERLKRDWPPINPPPAAKTRSGPAHS